jgi:hypothetical protein
MLSQHGIYYQQQIGGLCRMHSINGYFQSEQPSISASPKFTQSDWTQLQLQYDKYTNTTSSCIDYDLPSLGGMGIISWTLKQNNICSRYVPPGQAKDNLEWIINEKPSWFFMFDAGHIWGIKYHPHQFDHHVRQRSQPVEWFKVDSIGGVSPFNIEQLRRSQCGLVVPVKCFVEFKHNTQQLVEYNDHEIICQKLKDLHACGDCIGDFEIWITRAIGCLEIQLGQWDQTTDLYKQISPIILDWYFFLNKWSINPNQIELVLKWIPHFVHTICKLAELS